MIFQMRRQKAKSNRAFAYCRVSTEDQVKGESLGVQEARLEAIATAEGLTLAAVFVEEGVSGSKPLVSRPEGRRLLSAAKRGDTIVALKLDRMFRNTADAITTAEGLASRGVRLYLADMRGYIGGDAAGQLHLSMMAAFASFERQRLRERITDAKRALKAKGRYLGGEVPFGFTKVPTGETVLRHGVAIPVHRLEPIETIHTIARDLLAKGYSSRLAVGHFAQHGYDASHTATNGLFRYLREQAI